LLERRRTLSGFLDAGRTVTRKKGGGEKKKREEKRGLLRFVEVCLDFFDIAFIEGKKKDQEKGEEQR